MANNKFYVLISVLTPKEQKRFLDYINSPYFNKNDSIKLFVQCYLAAFSRKSEEELKDEQIFKAVFPNEPYKRDKLYRLRSESLLLLEKYLIYKQIQPDKGINYLSLLYFYAQKDLSRYFWEGLEIWNKQHKKQVLRNAEYYYEAYMEEKLLQFYLSKGQERRANKVLSSDSLNLNAFFHINILENLIFLWNRANIVKNEVDFEALFKKIEETLRFIARNANLSSNILVQSYILSLKMLKEEDGTPYLEDLQAFLAKNFAALPKEILKNEYIWMNNFCIKQINAGKKEYYEKQFDLYKLQLETGLLYNEKGQISVASFRNLLITALRLGHQNWAKSFLERHSGFLVSEDPKIMYLYCEGKMFFENKNYVEAKKIFSQIKLKDLLLSLDIRRTLIKCYYEMGETEQALLELENYHMYVHRKKGISDKHRERNRFFCNILKRMLDYIEGDTDKKKRLIIELQATQAISDKEWLYYKIKELK